MTTSPLDELFNAEGGADFLDAEGDFEFEITKAESTASNGGDPMLKLTMKVVDGPHAGKTQMTRYTYKENGSEAGKSIVWRSLQALGITQEFARSVANGVPPSSQITQLFVESAKRVVGVRVRANCSKQGGAGPYADRVQVNYDLKPSLAPRQVAAQAPIAVPESSPAVPPPQVEGLSIGTVADDAPAF